MSRQAAKGLVLDALSRAGIQLDGERPFDLRVKDEAFYDAVAREGLYGAREAYVDGLCEVARIDELVCRLERSEVDVPYASLVELGPRQLSGWLLNGQAGRKGLAVRRHYDLGNDLYEAMLDPRMNYSCAYWPSAKTLAEAQEAKLDLVCRKLGLRPGMRVLDIGCGFGGFARFAVERYGVSVVGVTISEQQLAYGRKACAGLPVELRLQDYRTLDGAARFDAVVSIGMFEHVGPKNYRRYLGLVRRCLRPEGLFLLHTIGGGESTSTFDPWTDKHIFPNAVLPSARQISAACEGVFVIEDWHNFGADYDRTLMAWFENFERAWPALRAVYGERFYRVWKCYLQTSAGAFRARRLHTWQLVLSGEGVDGGYRSLR